MTLNEVPVLAEAERAVCSRVSSYLNLSEGYKSTLTAIRTIVNDWGVHSESDAAGAYMGQFC